MDDMQEKPMETLLCKISEQLDRLISLMEKRSALEEKKIKCVSCNGDGKGYDGRRCIPCGGSGIRL